MKQGRREIRWTLPGRGSSAHVWYAGIIGLADALARANFFEWLAKLIAANVKVAGANRLLLMAALVLFSLAVRYLFASMAAYVASMIPVLFTLAVVAQVPALPFVFLIAFSAGYGGMLTHYVGALSPVLFGTGYVDQATWWRMGAMLALTSFVSTFAVSFFWWKLIGLW